MSEEFRSQNPESRMGTTRLAPAKSFGQLIVWQKAHQFVLGVYRFTDNFPRAEIYGLTSQLRRAAVSIPANIAEGFKKRGRADKVRFLNIAQGSLEECRYYLILAKDLNYGDTTKLQPQLEEVSKLLEAYSAKILASGF
jgi:four helix bundle protein